MHKTFYGGRVYISRGNDSNNNKNRQIVISAGLECFLGTLLPKPLL